MGEIRVKIELENFGDRYMYMEKKIDENEIRWCEMETVVDVVEVMLVLPIYMPESPIYPSLKLK